MDKGIELLSQSGVEEQKGSQEAGKTTEAVSAAASEKPFSNPGAIDGRA